MIYSLLFLFVAIPIVVNAQTITPLQQHEGVLHRKNAEQYFDELHVVPPGMNWRVVNEAVRDARLMRMRKLQEDVQSDSTIVQGTWREVGSRNLAGRVVASEIDFTTGRVWVAGAGGTIWQGTLEGKEWTCLNDHRRINDPVLIKHLRLASGVNRLIVVSGSPRIWYKDEGAEWTYAEGLDEIARWGGFQQAEYCERNGRLEIYALGYEWDYGPAWRPLGVLYRSTDSARSFHRVRWFDGLRSLWSDRLSLVVLLHADTLSTIQANGAVDHAGINLPWITLRAGSAHVAGSGRNNLAVAIVHQDSTIFYSVRLDPLHCELRSVLPVNPFDQQSFGFDPVNNRWLFGSINAYTCDHTLENWWLVNNWPEYYQNPETKLHADIPEIRTLQDVNGESVTFICTDGGLYTTIDGGITVQNISLRNLNVSQYYSSFTSRDNVDVLVAGSQDQGFQRSEVDYGGVRDFVQLISGDYSSLVSPDNTQKLFCVYPGFVMFVPNIEEGWTAQSLNFAHTNHLWLPPLASGPSRPNECWLGGGTNTKGAQVYVYRSQGGTLAMDSLGFDFGEGLSDVRITALAFAPSDDNAAYVVASHGIVWNTTNRGETWTSNPRPDRLTGHYFSGNALCVDRADANRLYLGGSGYDGPGVYLSTDAGMRWTPLAGLPPCLVLSLAVTPNGRWLAAATDAGAFLYDTLEKVWTDITALGAPDQVYWHVDYVPQLDIFRFCTYGRGIWDFSLKPVYTSVEENQYKRSPVSIVKARREHPISVVADSQQKAVVSWYDVTGRCWHSAPIQLRAGETQIPVPSGVSGATMIVAATEHGQVATAVLR